MKRAALALLAGALLLAGCSAPIDKDAVFLKLVHDHYTPASSDSTLVEMAKGACDSLKKGTSMKEIQNGIAATDLSQSKKVELATIVGYGIGVYCPEEK